LLMEFCNTLLGYALQRQKRSIYKEQTLLLFFGLLLPFITTMLHIFKLLPIRFDLTPLVFGPSGLLIAWGIFRYRLFNLVPVARSIVFDEMNTGVIVLDMEGRVVDFNPAATNLVGYSPSDALGMSAEKVFCSYPQLVQLYKSLSSANCELVVEKNDTLDYYEVTFKQLADSLNRPLGWLMLAYNITERKLNEELIKHTAYHDFLTELPNRKYFQEILSREIALAEGKNKILAVAFIDLDDFKQINDSYGHDTGDRFLCEVAVRLKAVLRNTDIISRQGGDEFALLLTDIKEKEDVTVIVGKIFKAFEIPVNIDNNELRIQASIGISIFPNDGNDIKNLLKKADAAMYVAKKSGKNALQFYTEKYRNFDLTPRNEMGFHDSYPE